MLKKIAILGLLASSLGMAFEMPENIEVKGGIGSNINIQDKTVSFIPKLEADVLFGEKLYEINSKNTIVIKGGIDLGLGYEKTKANQLTEHKIYITSDLVAIPQIKTEFKDFSLRNGIKLGLGARTQISKIDGQKAKAGVRPSAITSYVIGADYKNIAMDLELGVRHIFADKYTPNPKASLKVGYKFKY